LRVYELSAHKGNGLAKYNMKKEKFNKKLVLNKETISNLNDESMRKVVGGEEPSQAANTTCASREHSFCCLDSFATVCHAIAN